MAMQWIDAVISGVTEVGSPRARRSFAQLAMAFFAVIYFIVGFLIDGQGQGVLAVRGWGHVFWTLSFVYAVGVVSTGAEWFWARWFASGIGWSGLMVGVYSLVSTGPEPALVIYTVLHAVVVSGMRGKEVARLYDGRADWRERFGMDEHGASRLGKAITRASGALPALVMWAFAPKQPESLWALGMATNWVHIAVPLAVILGLGLMLRMKTVGLFVLAAGALMGVASHFVGSPFKILSQDTFGAAGIFDVASIGILGLIMLAASLVPFLGPIFSRLRSN